MALGQDYCYLVTQYELLKSRSLALRAINQLGLVERREPDEEPSLLAQLKQWVTDWLPKSNDEKPEPLSESALPWKASSAIPAKPDRRTGAQFAPG